MSVIKYGLFRWGDEINKFANKHVNRLELLKKTAEQLARRQATQAFEALRLG